MFRKELIGLLQDHPMELAEIARLFELTPREVEDDLQHLRKSLKHSAYRMQVTPAQCRKCAFVFDREKLHKPGKCPRCHGTWIQAPLVKIELRH